MDLSKPDPLLTLLRTEPSSYPDTNTRMDVWEKLASHAARHGWYGSYRRTLALIKLSQFLRKLCSKDKSR